MQPAHLLHPVTVGLELSPTQIQGSNVVSSNPRAWVGQVLSQHILTEEASLVALKVHNRPQNSKHSPMVLYTQPRHHYPFLPAVPGAARSWTPVAPRGSATGPGSLSPSPFEAKFVETGLSRRWAGERLGHC